MDQGADLQVREQPRKFFASLTLDLKRYAKREFELYDSDDDGITLQDHLRQVLKSAKAAEAHELVLKTEAELTNKPPSPLVTHLWFYYREISGMRGGGGMGVAALQPSIINEWQEMRGIELLPLEIDIICSLENTYLKFVSEKMQARNRQGT